MFSRHIPRVAGLAAVVALAASAALGLSSCSYQNEQELFTSKQLTCDTTSVTYRGTIEPLLAQNCQRCHGPTRAERGIMLTTHQTVQALGRNGRLLGVIQHQPGYPAMPADGPKLSACDISKFQKWVRAGMPDN